MTKKSFQIIGMEEGRPEKQWTNTFETLAAASKYIQDRWQGPEYIDGADEFHTDFATFQLQGFTLKDIGIMGWVDSCRTFVFTPLPADVDGRNDDRAQWAQAALDAFMHKTGSDREDATCDLLANLRHWCDRNGFDWGNELDRAMRHYTQETKQD